MPNTIFLVMFLAAFTGGFTAMIMGLVNSDDRFEEKILREELTQAEDSAYRALKGE